MRQFTWAAAAAVTVAIALSAPGNQPAAVAASAGEAPLVLVASGCPRLISPKCPKYYVARCVQWGRGAIAWQKRCCTRMGCVAAPH